MRKNQSQFIKIQPFIQYLRPSLHLPKDNLIDVLTSNQIINTNQVLKFNPREKSVSKSKILRVIRKISVETNLKQLQKNSPECSYSKNQLEINFNKICTKNIPSESLRCILNTPETQNSFDLKDLKISIVFSKHQTQNFQHNNPFASLNNQKLLKNQQTKIKIQITCFQLSIEDESKVKRTFDFNLIEKLDKKQYLKIQISEGLKPQILSLNSKIISPKEQVALPLRQQDKICELKPWQLINQRKSLLQDKILSVRPKSKIKWSFSLTESTQNFEKTESKMGKASEVEQNYGLRASQESALKLSLQLKSRNHFNLNMKKESPYMNVFYPRVKQEVEQMSMKSTFESEDRSSRKQQFGSSNDAKRVNNMVASLNFKEVKLLTGQNMEGGSKGLRPKSSFKNLKDRNDYFQMRESERKKSVKKNVDACYERTKMDVKSSEIKQEYGIC